MVEWMKAGPSPRGSAAGGRFRFAFIGSVVWTIFFTILYSIFSPFQAGAESTNQTFPIPSGTVDVEVINQIGTIRVISSDVYTEKVVLNARQISGETRISTSQSPTGKVTIEVRGRGMVDIEVVVPALARLDLLTYRGNIEVRNHVGQIRARVASDGDIFFSDLRSTAVEGHCHYGNVYFSGPLLAQGDYRLKSFTGRLDVSFPASADFKLSAATHHGGLDLHDFPLRYDLEMRDIVEAVSGLGRSNVLLWTQEGSIRLHRQM
jgi:hypothetical protein